MKFLHNNVQPVNSDSYCAAQSTRNYKILFIIMIDQKAVEQTHTDEPSSLSLQILEKDRCSPMLIEENLSLWQN